MKNNLKNTSSQLTPKVLFSFRKTASQAKLIDTTDPTTATTATVTTMGFPAR